MPIQFLDPSLVTYGVPFLFILAIVFGALEVAGVFKNKYVKMLISLAIAVITATNAQVVSVINQILPYAAIGFVVIFFLAFLFKSFKTQEGDWPLIIISGGLLLLVFVVLGANWQQFFKFLPVTYNNFLWIIGIILFIVVLYGAYKVGSDHKSQ